MKYGLQAHFFPSQLYVESEEAAVIIYANDKLFPVDNSEGGVVDSKVYQVNNKVLAVQCRPK